VGGLDVGDWSEAYVGRVLAERVPDVLAAQVADTVFWTGAGISADLPAGAPVGNVLADRALDHAFAVGTLAAVVESYQALRITRQRPRLETLLDVVFSAHGLSALADLLSDLRDPPPNGIHSFFAAHAAAGGKHITANFDPCIESAVTGGQKVEVFHFHGSFADDPSGQGLGARLGEIEHGFPATIRDRLAAILTTGPPAALVFAGYSGSDFFDADPLLRALATKGGLGGMTVLWVDHREHSPRMISGDEAARAREQLGSLHRAGAQVHQISAPTRLVLTALAQAWRLPPPALPHGTAHSWRSNVAVSGPARQTATLELMALMGLHGQVTRLLGCHPPTTSREWAIAAQTAWAAGRYRDAGGAWQRAFPSESVTDRTARCERAGACQWIRGQSRRAYRTLRWALSLAAGLPTSESSLRIQVAETLGRVLVHMRRSPDTRFLATCRRRAFALSQIPSPDDPLLGTHLRARVRSIRADLGDPGISGSQWEEFQNAFREYEAMNAQLNYRHAELRHAAATGPVPASHFRQLRSDFTALGACGDAARVPLIPGGEHAFTILETIHGIRQLDITPWHRCRLTLGYLIQRMLADSN
jgi:hypothetical protein